MTKMLAPEQKNSFDQINSLFNIKNVIEKMTAIFIPVFNFPREMIETGIQNINRLNIENNKLLIENLGLNDKITELEKRIGELEKKIDITPFISEKIVSDLEIEQYILSIGKESMIYPSDLVFEFGIDYERAEKLLEDLVKKEKLERQ